MGREIKRVALDFKAPINKVWEGYINPHYEHCGKCDACDGSGYSPYGEYLQELWYGNQLFKPEDNGSIPFLPTDRCIIDMAKRNVKQPYTEFGDEDFSVQAEARRLCKHFNSCWCYHLNDEDIKILLADERLLSITHVRTCQDTEEDIRTHAYYLWVEAGRPDGVCFWQQSVDAHNRYYLPYPNGIIPTAREVCEWSMGAFGLSGSDCFLLSRTRAEKEGKSVTCVICGGEGAIWDSSENEQNAINWERIEPPVGEGYQCWETVTDGSPISPVFATPEELAVYMVNNPWNSCDSSSYETWLRFIQGPGWAPSIVVDSNGFHTGVEFTANQEFLEHCIEQEFLEHCIEEDVF